MLKVGLSMNKKILKQKYTWGNIRKILNKKKLRWRKIIKVIRKKEGEPITHSSPKNEEEK